MPSDTAFEGYAVMQIYTLKTLNITSSPKTGDKTYELVKQEIETIESVNKVPVIAVVSELLAKLQRLDIY